MLFEKSVNLSLKITQIIFHMFGIWRPNYLTGFLKHLYNFYSLFSFMFVIGTYVIVQTGDLVQVWGNLSYMTANVFLLFTNLVLGHKALNAMWKKKVIQGMLAESYLELEGETRIMGRAIVTSSDDETTRWFALYASLTFMTVSGWALSAEKNQLPLRAWYPYDTSKTPAYQLTYAHQSITIFMAAAINVCVDTVVTSMMAMCRCRLRLVGLSLTTLCDGQKIADDGRLTVASDEVVSGRLRHCATRHQAVLTQVADLQYCFSMPLLSQFTVSMVINCVTAYQLAFESPSLVRIISMITYLLGMLLQVFIYCYQGNRLFEESEAVSSAAYECPWYTCSIPVRRSLVLVMTRTRRAAALTAGGFTQLSLPTFMAIIKTSYTFFTVLQQVKET